MPGFRSIVMRLAGATLLALAPGLARAQANDALQAIYEAAKKEGKVTFWTSNDVQVVTNSAVEFNKRFPGITVEAFKIEPAPAIERILGEASANRLSADVVDTPFAYMPQLLDRNMVEPYDWEKLGVDKRDILFDNRALHLYDLDIPIVINTSLVKPGEIKSWDDLADPKWRGKVLLEARGLPFAVLALKWGEAKTHELIRKILANKPVIIKGGTPTIEALAGGQGAVAVGTYSGRALQYKRDGAPVDWARVGPVPALIYVQMPLKGAPHPNAAKLWTWWMQTPAHQKALWDWHLFGPLRGPNINPVGKEMGAAGLEIVFESPDAKEMQRLLAGAGAAIGSLK